MTLMTVRLHLRPIVAVLGLGAMVAGGSAAIGGQTELFDHSYRAYGAVLRAHVVGTRVDYADLKRNRASLDAVVAELGQVRMQQMTSWTREQQIAYLINAYNAFTLQAIIDHYPIQARWFRWFTFTPRNSIKQIGGVWTQLRWRVAGANMTLDEIEHDTLRAEYGEPRIHFAVNCASVSCPPIRREPYVGDQLDRQLTLAARDFLATDLGLQVDGETLRVSSIFNWYGEDFIDTYAPLIDAERSAAERALLGVVAKYGPSKASALAQGAAVRIGFLRYDWSLNDTAAE